MLMILFQMQRKDFCVPQLFAAAGNLHSLTLTSSYEAFIQYDAAFTVPSQTTAENFLPRVANFFEYFDALMFPSHIFLRLSVRPLKISWASLRKEHGRLQICAYNKAQQGLRHVKFRAIHEAMQKSKDNECIYRFLKQVAHIWMMFVPLKPWNWLPKVTVKRYSSLFCSVL